MSYGIGIWGLALVTNHLPVRHSSRARGTSRITSTARLLPTTILRPLF